MFDLFTTGSETLIPTLVDAALKVALLLALAGLAAAMMGKQSAAARHAVWTFSILAALAIPPLEAVLPAWRAEIFELPVPQQSYSPTVTATAVTTPAVGPTMREETIDGKPTSSLVAVKTRGVEATPDPIKTSFDLGDFTPLQIVLALWALGFTLALAPLAISLYRVNAFTRRAKRGLSPLWQATLDDLPASARPSRNVEYLESEEASMPLACGIISPLVIVPGNTNRWPAWKRRNVLVHELAHVQRLDCLTQLFATVLCAVYWFNPLTWIAASRMRFERELACDDRVLAAGSPPVEYADHLLEVARSLRPEAGTAMAAIAMARTSHLSMRLLAVLDSSRSRSGMSRRSASILAVVAIVLLLPLAAFKPWKSGVERDGIATENGPAVALYSIPTMLNTGVTPDAHLSFDLKAAPVATLTGIGMPSSDWVCEPGSAKGSTSIHEDSKGTSRMTLKHSSGDCTLEITTDGKFTLADDLSDVATVTPGATVTIKETNRGTVRKMEIRSVGGNIQRQYYVNGVSTPFGSDERRWLAETLLAVERRTAYSAKTRVPRLWSDGGVNAVLSEISRMESSYAKRMYLTALFDSGNNFDARTLTRLIRQVDAEFTSDYERRMILSRIPAQKLMDGNSWNAFADAIGRMGSDYEKRIILTEAFKQGRLSPASAARLLDVSAKIKSPYELAQVLLGPAVGYATIPVSRPAYVAAVRKINSDYERRRVLIALIDQFGAEPGSVNDLLEPAAAMGSDYEKSEVIRAFTKRGRLNTEAFASLTAIAGTIKSDYEKHRSLTGILESSPRLDSRGLVDLLNVAASIRSDYELATLLREVIARYPWSSVPREAFERALASISSDTEENSVRAAIQRAENR